MTAQRGDCERHRLDVVDVTDDYIRDLFAAAWLEGLEHRHQQSQDGPAPAARLDTAGRDPIVTLRGDRG